MPGPKNCGEVAIIARHRVFEAGATAAIICRGISEMILAMSIGKVTADRGYCGEQRG